VASCCDRGVDLGESLESSGVVGFAWFDVGEGVGPGRRLPGDLDGAVEWVLDVSAWVAVRSESDCQDLRSLDQVSA